MSWKLIFFLKMLLIATFVESCFSQKVIWECTTWYIIESNQTSVENEKFFWKCFCLQLLWKVIFVKKLSENAWLNISLKVLKHWLKMLFIATFVEIYLHPKIIWECTTWYIIVESGSWQNGICEITYLFFKMYEFMCSLW